MSCLRLNSKWHPEQTASQNPAAYAYLVTVSGYFDVLSEYERIYIGVFRSLSTLSLRSTPSPFRNHDDLVLYSSNH